MSLQENTTNLSMILDKVRALPEQGSGGSIYATLKAKPSLTMFEPQYTGYVNEVIMEVG